MLNLMGKKIFKFYAQNFVYLNLWSFMKITNFMLISLEHENGFLTSIPGTVQNNLTATETSFDAASIAIIITGLDKQKFSA